VVSKSTDAGLNWTHQTIASGTIYGYLRAIAVDPSDTDNVYALGYYNSANRLYFTDDGGSTWQERAMTGFSGTAYDLVVHPDDGSRMASATSQGLYATEDGGSTWTRVTTAFTGAWCVQNTENSDDLLVGTNANGAWVWDGWEGAPYAIGTGMTSNRVNLFIQGTDFIYAGTHGNSMWRNYIGTSIEDCSAGVISPLGFAVSPNPVTGGAATASFTLPGDAPGLLQIFDLTGRVVMEFSPSEGEQQRLMDVSSLPPGAYISRLTSAGESAVVRMVVIR